MNIRDYIPGWPPRDWRAFIALAGSIAGAAVLTGFAWWMVSLLDGYAQRLLTAMIDGRKVQTEAAGVLVIVIRTLSWGLKLLLAGVIAVLLSLGLAINRRQISLSRSGLNMSGGDGDEPPLAPPPSPETVRAAAAGAAAGALAGAAEPSQGA